MTLCDSGVLLSLADGNDPKSDECRKAVLRAAIPLITTWPCVAETMHLLGRRRGGWRMQSKLAERLLNRLILVHEIPHYDCKRLFALMEQYRDRPMDLADASLVLVAEKTGKRKILTLDSDFSIYRINNRDSFEVLAI